jgi:hypothetical protein
MKYFISQRPRMTVQRDGQRVLPAHLRSRLFLAATLLMAFFVHLTHGWDVRKAGTQGFLIGDWTISYAGGFVRRGLFGTLLLRWFPDGAEALLALWLIQTALYAAMFGVVLHWVMLVRQPSRWVMLFLSPAFLMFGVNDLGGTHRKEIIALAALMLLGNSVAVSRHVKLTALIALGLFTGAAFSHELNALLVAPFIILLTWAKEAEKVSARFHHLVASSFGGVAIAGVVAAVLAPGTIGQQEAICRDLLQRGLAEALCQGSLTYLGASAGEAVAMVSDNVFYAVLIHAVPVALIVMALSFVPWARENIRLLLVANAGIVPLFVIAVDWGRWIMIAATVTTVLVFVGSVREGSQPDEVPLNWVLIYILSWRVPHVAASWTTLGPSRMVPEFARLTESAISLLRSSVN